MRHLLQDNSTADSSAGPSNELVEVGWQLLHLLHPSIAVLLSDFSGHYMKGRLVLQS